MSFRQAMIAFAAHFTRLPRGVATVAALSLLLTGPRLEAQTAHFDGAVRLNSTASGNSVGRVESGRATFEPVKVGSVSPTILSISFSFDTEGTLGSTAVVTRGAKNLDFTDAGTGTCKAGTANAANATCTVNVTFKPRAPGLRYGAAQLLDSHGKALAIANLSGIGTEPQPNFLPAGVFSHFGVGLFATATSVAVDGSGDLFITDGGNSTQTPVVSSAVYEVLAVDGSIPASPTINTLGSGFSNPSGVALDGSGNIYVADTGNQVVAVIPAGCADIDCDVSTIGSGFAAPSAVAVDGSGNVFVTDSTNNAVYEILAGCTSTSCTTNRLASSFVFSNPNGVAVDGSGNVFVADTGNGALEEIVAVGDKIPATNPTVRTLASGFDEPWGIAVMANGSVLGSDAYQQSVFEILAIDGSITADSPAILALKGPTTPLGIALDGKGNVFVADYGEDLEDTSSVYIAKLAANPSVVFPTPTAAFHVDTTDGPMTLMVVNGGNATLTSEGPGLTAPAANFTLVPGSGTPPDCTASFSLAPGGACNLNIEFAPVDAGNPLSATVVLTDNSLGATNATQTVSLSGVGTAPVIVLSPTSLPEGTLGTTYSQAITASGGPPSFSYSYAVTAGSLPPGLTLSSGGGLNGTPTANGTFSFTVTASGRSSGTGTFTGSQAYVVAISANLGIVSVGSASTSATSVILTVQESGTLNSIAALTLGASGLDFSNAGGGTCTVGASYTAGNTCTVKLAFKPLAPGLRRGAVQLLNASGKLLATVYVQGTGYGPRVNFLSATQTNLGTGFNSPTGVAEDGHGNIFVTDGETNSLYELEAGCTPSACTVLTLNSSFIHPNRVAVDGGGNIFVADAGAGPGGYGALYEFLAGCTPSACTALNLGSNFANPGGFSGFYSPTGVAVDGSGNIFLTDQGNPGGDSAVYELLTGCTPSACTVLTLNTDLGFPQDVAVDGNGNLFVTSYGGFAELLAPCTPAACTVNSLGSFSSPLGVAVDGSGNVFDTTDNAVYEMLAVGGSIPATDPTILTLASGFNNPLGVTVDASGNVLVADAENSRVAMLNLSTPPSLNFPTPTGVSSIDTADGPKTVKVIDGGNSPLLFSVPTSGVNPNYPANFPVNASDKSLCSSSSLLAVNSICDVSANFEPAAAGANTGSIVLTDNTLNQTKATQSIPLSGTGKAMPTITWKTPAAITYGTALSATQLDATASVGGTFKYSPAAGTILKAGTQTLSVTFTPTETSEYGSATATVSLTVNKAQPAITWAAPAAITYGIALSATQLDATSSVAGAFVYSPVPGTVLNAGSQTLSVTLTPTDTADYISATKATTLTINKAATAATVVSSINPSAVGQSVTFTATVTSPHTAATGTVTFKDGSTALGSGTLNSSGVATYKTSSLATGAHSITAVYAGDGNTLTSTSTALTQTVDTAATMTSPTPGSVLAGPSATFTWTSATGSAGYWLFLGTTGVGSKDLYDSGEQTATSATFSSLPTNGVTIYARVYTSHSGVLVYNDYAYTAAAKAVLITPTPGSSLTRTSVTFNWTAATGSGNQGYWLFLGTTGVGSKNLYDSGQLTTTSATFSNLPTDGVTIYARIYTRYDGVLFYNDYTYTAWMQPPMLISPAPGSTLPGASATFTWTAETGSQGYWLFLGTTGVGSKNLYDSGQQTSTSATFSSLPTNGETIYARVYTRYNGVLVSSDFTYKAVAGAVMTTPASGSSFTGAGVTFDWTAATGSGNQGYWLFLGTAERWIEESL